MLLIAPRRPGEPDQIRHPGEAVRSSSEKDSYRSRKVARVPMTCLPLGPARRASLTQGVALPGALGCASLVVFAAGGVQRRCSTWRKVAALATTGSQSIGTSATMLAPKQAAQVVESVSEVSLAPVPEAIATASRQHRFDPALLGELHESGSTRTATDNAGNDVAAVPQIGDREGIPFPVDVQNPRRPAVDHQAERRSVVRAQTPRSVPEHAGLTGRVVADWPAAVRAPARCCCERGPRHQPGTTPQRSRRRRTSPRPSGGPSCSSSQTMSPTRTSPKTGASASSSRGMSSLRSSATSAT